MNKVKSLKNISRAVIVALCLSTCLPSSSHAQSSEQRLRRLENEIQTLSKAVFKGDKTVQSSYVMNNRAAANESAALSVRLSQLENEVRSLTGRIEQQSYEMRQLNDRLNQALNDLEQQKIVYDSRQDAHDFSQINPAAGQATTSGRIRDQIRDDIQQKRNQTIEALSLNAPAAKNAQHMNVQGRTNETNNTTTGATKDNILGSYTVQADKADETDLAAQVSSPYADADLQAASKYDEAFSFIRRKEYDQAEIAFSGFLKQYPNHSLAPNAQYWLAETHYVRNNYETAARLFAEAYKSEPAGTKAPDNLLKLGLSLSGMGNTDDACIALKQIDKQFSNGPSPILNRANTEISRLSCPN